MAEACRRAGTVHVAGSLEEMVAAERETNRGRMPERPFVLLGQQYLADPERSAGNVHPIWAYAHVPNGYDGDGEKAVLDQIERFASPSTRTRPAFPASSSAPPRRPPAAASTAWAGTTLHSRHCVISAGADEYAGRLVSRRLPILSLAAALLLAVAGVFALGDEGRAADAAITPVDSSACGPVQYGGTGTAQALIVSDLPLQGTRGGARCR